MNCIYCPNCGFKNDYAGIRPKICSSCNEPFEKAIAKIVKKVIERRAENEAVETQEYEEPVSPKLIFDIGVDSKPKIMTIGSIRQAGAGGFERDDSDREVSELRKKAQETLMQETQASLAAAPMITPRPKRGRPRKK